MLYLGLSIIDVTTGQSTVYETHSNQDDYKFVLDEILSVYPSEDGIGTQIHSHRGSTWKVMEDHETIVKRLNE